MADEIEIWRSGAKSDHLTKPRGATATIWSGHPSRPRDSTGGVTILADVPTKGAEHARTFLWIPPSMFEHLAAAMIRAAPKEAAAAFLKQTKAMEAANAQRP
jgi:hypothetical protein